MTDIEAQRFPNAFFQGPAISFERQPNLRRLFELLVDETAQFTLVVGAGVSLDAELPSWSRLISNIVDQIWDEKWRAEAKRDSAELLRKAESSLQLALEDSAHNRDAIIRQALYLSPNGKAIKTPKFGRLGDAVARLAISLRGRVKVATTNFDTLLEKALFAYLDDGRMSPSSVPFPGYKRTTDDPFELDIPAQWTPGDSVLHLHGILEPGRNPLGKIVLTETDFLRQGPAVRDLIKVALRETHVIFIGVSMTDPNLVSPLWEIAESADPNIKDPFMLTVASPDPEAEDEPTIRSSRAYAIKKGQYLDAELGLRTIFLKSYGQQIQLVSEATLAILEPDLYLNESDSKVSLRYGYRLQRALNTCYASIGCVEGFDAPTGENAQVLSDSLYAELTASRENSINDIFQQVRDRLINANDIDELTQYRASQESFMSEKFGLFLWLRATRDDGFPAAHYQLKLVGSSAYMHREAEWSLDRVADVSPISRFTCGRAAFSGRPEVEDIAYGQDWKLWHSIRAVPYSFYLPDQPSVGGSDSKPASTSKTAPDSGVAAIDVGVITLNSTHNLVSNSDSGEWNNGARRSLVSMMIEAEVDALNNELARIALSIVSRSALGEM